MIKKPEEELNYGSISDMVAASILKKLGLDQAHVDKAREIIDMVEFTVIDDDEIILIRVGNNIEVRINK